MLDKSILKPIKHFIFIVDRNFTYNAISLTGKGFVLSNMDYYCSSQKGSNQTYNSISERKKIPTVSIDSDEYQVNDSMGQIMIMILDKFNYL